MKAVSITTMNTTERSSKADHQVKIPNCENSYKDSLLDFLRSIIIFFDQNFFEKNRISIILFIFINLRYVNYI